MLILCAQRDTTSDFSINSTLLHKPLVNYNLSHISQAAPNTVQRLELHWGRHAFVSDAPPPMQFPSLMGVHFWGLLSAALFNSAFFCPDHMCLIASMLPLLKKAMGAASAQYVTAVAVNAERCPPQWLSR